MGKTSARRRCGNNHSIKSPRNLSSKSPFFELLSFLDTINRAGNLKRLSYKEVPRPFLDHPTKREPLKCIEDDEQLVKKGKEIGREAEMGSECVE